jgi:8-oxo-dGTP pyrophosphatase MutT (NUDIX family)
MTAYAPTMDQFARLPVGVRRLAYRMAYAGLCAYWFIRRPRSEGVKCVITDGDHVLLVRHTYGRPDWELPGGAIKSSEEPIGAARREMSEELGVAIDDWTALGEVHARQQHRRDTLHCFHAELHQPAFTIDLGELYEARWFPRSRLPAAIGRYVNPILARLPTL